MPVPEEWSLAGKSALVTADRRGWTPYLASALAEAGADVALVGRQGGSDMADAAKAGEQHGRRAVPIEADITNAGDVDSVVAKAVAELGKVDILVNNARVEFGKPLVDVTEDEWQTVMDFNVKSMFLCCKAVGKHMIERGGGRIVNIGSGLAVRGLANSVAACASHGAIHQLTTALALEWALNNIRVNGIGAGWISTEAPKEEDQQDRLVRFLPSRRRGHPTDLCGLLVYLASDACNFVTGQMVFIDGGALAHA